MYTYKTYIVRKGKLDLVINYINYINYLILYISIVLIANINEICIILAKTFHLKYFSLEVIRNMFKITYAQKLFISMSFKIYNADTKNNTC